MVPLWKWISGWQEFSSPACWDFLLVWSVVCSKALNGEGGCPVLATIHCFLLCHPLKSVIQTKLKYYLTKFNGTLILTQWKWMGQDCTQPVNEGERLVISVLEYFIVGVSNFSATLGEYRMSTPWKENGRLKCLSPAWLFLQLDTNQYKSFWANPWNFGVFLYSGCLWVFFHGKPLAVLLILLGDVWKDRCERSMLLNLVQIPLVNQISHSRCQK